MWERAIGGPSVNICVAPLRKRSVKRAALGVLAALVAVLLYVRVFEKPLITNTRHLEAAKDFSQDAVLDHSQDIFFGTVEEKIGDLSRNSDLPESQFLVSVDKSLKGDASGNVVVNQLGGYAIGGLVLELFEEDPLLEPGQKYLLFTADYETEVGKNGWRSLFFPGFTKREVTSRNVERELEQRFERQL